MKGCAPRLVLKQREKATRKWLIGLVDAVQATLNELFITVTKLYHEISNK